MAAFGNTSADSPMALRIDDAIRQLHDIEKLLASSGEHPTKTHREETTPVEVSSCFLGGEGVGIRGNYNGTARKRGKEKRYEVRNEKLEEFRFDDPNPLRCSKDVFSTLVEFLAAQRKPLPFNNILEATGKRLGIEIADFQMRVALRFLTDPSIRLVARSKAKYRILCDARDFQQRAMQEWNKLNLQSANQLDDFAMGD